MDVNLLLPCRQAGEEPAENRSHANPGPRMLPHRIRHLTSNVQIPAHEQRLVAQFSPDAREFIRYSLFFFLWFSHSRSLSNSASVVGKSGLTIRNRKITPAAMLVKSSSPPQASALQPHSQWKINIKR